VFRKRLMHHEEGKVQRRFAAAKLSKPSVQSAAAAVDAGATASAANAALLLGNRSGIRLPRDLAEPEKEPEKVEQLYQAFVSAKQQAGEETAKLSRSSFNEFVRKKTKDLQTSKNCRDVEYVVEVVAGQVKLKALVKSYFIASPRFPQAAFPKRRFSA
jgi:hypothetical protein